MENQQSDIFFQLISNKDFRDWVQHPNEGRNSYWEKWMEAHPENTVDVQTAREWIERMTFKRHRLESFEQEELLLKIVAGEKSVMASKEERRTSWSGGRALLRIAAVLVILFAATWLIHRVVNETQSQGGPVAVKWKSLENPKGRKSRITLPDGSRVDLNYESSLKFPERFEGGVRRVELIGEAFFDVEHHDSLPFIVATGETETMVLGTTFNIRSKAKGGATEISLLSGKVQVKYPEGAERSQLVDLLPGEQLYYDHLTGTSEKLAFDPERVTAWKEGIILFEDAGFEDFIGELERWYGVNFQIHGTPPQHWKINGRYNNEALDDILSGLSFVYGLEYRIQGDNVILNLQ